MTVVVELYAELLYWQVAGWGEDNLGIGNQAGCEPGGHTGRRRTAHGAHLKHTGTLNSPPQFVGRLSHMHQRKRGCGVVYLLRIVTFS